mgnify:CR=1 FL=1
MVYSDIMRYGKLELKKVDSVNFISEFGFVHHKKNLQYGREKHMVFQNAVKGDSAVLSFRKQAVNRPNELCSANKG